MARDWEEQFKMWAKPPGQTEQERCDNAVSAIRNAISASDKLNRRSITVFAQGSYRNNTNVQQDSDVDVGILCSDTFFYALPEGASPENFEINPSTYSYAQFKDDVQKALEDYFGRSAIDRGNKAFDVHETTHHVEADVAAFFEHRRYHVGGRHTDGVALLTDREGRRIENWPQQHYDNGCTKNIATGKRYKSIVRVLKALSSEMAEYGINAANVPGFLVECLGWNIPNDHFQKPTCFADVRAVLAFIFNKTLQYDDCKEWSEVSDLIYLFHTQQRWTWQQAHAFAAAAWDYIGFKD